MSIIVHVTTQESPITVDVTIPPAEPVAVDVTLVSEPVEVSVSLAAAPAIVVDVALVSTVVAVEVSEGRDAYQLAVAGGFVGTRAEWLESLRGEPGEPGEPGPAGANAEVVVLRNIPGGPTAMAQYIALPPAEQMSGKWFVIAK